MSYRELVILKLQMGINPSARIELAMWQQLQLENAQTQDDQSSTSRPQSID